LRAASLILAAAASVIGLVFPFLLARQPTALNQSILLVMMAAIAGCFIHGTGFRPAPASLRMVTAPWLTWPTLLGCFALLVLMR
jgi:predicted membrane protein